MKKLILLLLIILPFLGHTQNVAGDELRIYKEASIGEDGIIYPLNVNGNRIINAQDPINPQDVATSQWVLDNTITGEVPFLDFEVNTIDPIYQQARLWYDSLKAEMVFYDRVVDMKFGTVSELSIRVLNNSGGTIIMGDVVYPTGASGGLVTIDMAQANTYATSRPVGLAKSTMLNGEEGWVMLRGTLENVNTSLLSGGIFYLSPTIAGGKTSTIPNNGNFIVRGGAVAVIDAINGVIQVDPFTNEYTAESISPRGWSQGVIDNTTLFPNSTTRTFTIIGDGYVYEDGVKYSFSSPTVIWPDTEGTVDVYFDKGVLTTAANQTEAQVRDIYSSKPGVSRMYWDALNDTLIFANNMRHTFDMNGDTWAAFWDFHKCEIIDGGLGLTDIIVDAVGNLDSHAQFGNSSALIRNQDIITVVPSQASTVGYTVFYREGAGGSWRSQDGAPFAILTTGTGRAAWNEDVAGTWQLTEATNGYILPYIFLTSNTLGDKVGTIMPSAEYATKADAETGALETIGALFQGLPIKEIKTVAIVLYETRTNYMNAVDSRIVSTTTGDDYIDLRFQTIAGGGSAGTTTSFLALSDTQPNYAGFAGQFPVVNIGETGLDFAEAAKTINGQSPTAGNYNITMTQNKIGNIVTLNTSGTGNSVNINLDDGDADSDNENQDLSNSKLNNTFTINISNGLGTTVTNIARTDFANTFSGNQNITGTLTLSGALTSGDISGGKGTFKSTNNNVITAENETGNAYAIIKGGKLGVVAKNSSLQLADNFNQKEFTLRNDASSQTLKLLGDNEVPILLEVDQSGNLTVLNNIDTSGDITASSFSGSGSALTNLNATNVSSGTLADARLSSNVPLLNLANTFSQKQTAPILQGKSNSPSLEFHEEDQSGQGEYWRTWIRAKEYELVYADNALFTSSSNAISVIPDGGVQLYYNDALKFSTTNTGATLNGDLIADDIDCTTLDATGNITALDVSTTSDIRLKRDIKPLINLDKFDDIKFYEFKMSKSDTLRQRYGVGAQYIEDEHPEFIHIANDSMQSKSVNYIDLLVVKIARLEQRIDRLDGSKENKDIPYIPIALILVSGIILIQLIKK